MINLIIFILSSPKLSLVLFFNTKIENLFKISNMERATILLITWKSVSKVQLSSYFRYIIYDFQRVTEYVELSHCIYSHAVKDLAKRNFMEYLKNKRKWRILGEKTTTTSCYRKIIFSVFKETDWKLVSDHWRNCSPKVTHIQSSTLVMTCGRCLFFACLISWAENNGL